MGHSSFIFCFRFPPSFLPLSCYSPLSTYRDMLLKQEFGNCLVLRSTIEGETCNWQYPLSSYILFLPQKSKEGWGNLWDFLREDFAKPSFPRLAAHAKGKAHTSTQGCKEIPLFSLSLPFFPSPHFPRNDTHTICHPRLYTRQNFFHPIPRAVHHHHIYQRPTSFFHIKTIYEKISFFACI